MSMIPVHATEQLADARLEVRVAARATPPAGRTKIRHRGIAERAPQPLAVRHGELLVRVVEKLTQRMFGRRDCGLDATLRRASLAQMQLVNGVVLNRREVDDGVPLVTAIAQH